MRDRTRQARRGAFTGPARSRSTKITAYTICVTPGCGHMRSAHPSRGACRHADGPFACRCTEFTVPPPAPPARPANPVYTEADYATWRDALERGLSYRDVNRKYGVSECTLRNRLPGYNANSTHPNGSNGIRNNT